MPRPLVNIAIVVVAVVSMGGWTWLLGMGVKWLILHFR
jgi:hypothetical protein